MPGTVQQNGRWDRRQDWAGVTRHCTNHRAHGLTPMPHYAANSCTEDNAAWGATSGLLWPRNQYPGAIIPSKASAACSRGSTARGPMSAKAPRDGLASAPTEPQPPTTSSRDDLHVPRTGQGLPVTMLSTVHMGWRPCLTVLPTPAPRTTQHGEPRLGYCGLGISTQGQ